MFTFAYIYNKETIRFQHESREILLDKIRSDFKKNNIIFLEKEINNTIDRQAKFSTNKSAEAKISLADAIVGAKAILNYTTGKSTSDSEILRRSSICEKCPLMTDISGCSSCGLSGAIARFTNQVRSHKGSQIPIPASVAKRYCSVCQCALSLMVVTKTEDFYSETPEKNQRRPDNCWLKKTSINYIP